jgi:hypothetical protein
MDDDLRQRWQDYIDTFPEQRREESD